MENILDTVGKRLNYAKKQAGITYTELAKLIGEGATGAALNTAFTRNTTKDVYINLICEKLGLDRDWVLSGEGKFKFTKKNSGYSKEVVQVPFGEFMEAKYLPVAAQAGYLSSLEGVNGIDLQTILVPKEFEKGNFTVVEITGTSMDDGTNRSICDGDKLLVKEWESNSKLPYLQYLFVIVSREGLVCKQIIKEDSQNRILSCRSFNSAYRDYDISMDDVLQLFIVKKIVERRIKF
ncbi:S24 family peptidase [Flavobacterium sp.]|uniref:S24 family peptidase n=1 Tax=Flavobacterium sp. TaxID=239 RepID=UPI003D6B2027